MEFVVKLRSRDGFIAGFWDSRCEMLSRSGLRSIFTVGICVVFEIIV